MAEYRCEQCEEYVPALHPWQGDANGLYMCEQCTATARDNSVACARCGWLTPTDDVWLASLGDDDEFTCGHCDDDSPTAGDRPLGELLDGIGWVSGPIVSHHVHISPDGLRYAVVVWALDDGLRVGLWRSEPRHFDRWGYDYPAQYWYVSGGHVPCTESDAADSVAVIAHLISTGVMDCQQSEADIIYPMMTADMIGGA